MHFQGSLVVYFPNDIQNSNGILNEQLFFKLKYAPRKKPLI
jgi:hypothetical protein